MTHADFCKQFLPPNGALLDVGSGKGKFLIEMAMLGFRSYGIDANPEYTEVAKKMAKNAGVSIDLAQAQAELLPFNDNYFDFVNCSEVSEHVEDPPKMCQEMFRVLKRGGAGYISFHNRFGIYDYHYHLYLINWLPRSWTEPILRLLGKQKSDSNVGRQKLITMHYYTYRQVCKLLRQDGFLYEDVRIKKIADKFSYASPLILMPYKFMLRPFYFNTFHFLIRKL